MTDGKREWLPVKDFLSDKTVFLQFNQRTGEHAPRNLQNRLDRVATIAGRLFLLFPEICLLHVLHQQGTAQQDGQGRKDGRTGIPHADHEAHFPGLPAGVQSGGKVAGSCQDQGQAHHQHPAGQQAGAPFPPGRTGVGGIVVICVFPVHDGTLFYVLCVSCREGGVFSVSCSIIHFGEKKSMKNIYQHVSRSLQGHTA